MDWHQVDIDPKYGTGWTGYTWNRELFPDPERFLKGLHERGMRTTLNVHPADGIRACEDCYPEVAKAMGVDASKEEPVNFDIADPAFLDSGREGRRPMTFSRYAGAGSHRYPVGFSGDSIISWESLDFQPYFTSTASNIGYGWWSHDIGGHMMGAKDDELAARWYQFGVFSPINRLHSSNSLFNGKEPWRFKQEVHDTMNAFLRLRHQMVPYLYTMNYRNWEEGMPLCQPLYYHYPGKWESYMRKNQYFFGSELMAAPVTTPCIKSINRAETVSQNPESLTVRIYPGADNEFILYEDDNVSQGYLSGNCVKTKMCLDWEKRRFTIFPAKGDVSLIPDKRNWKIEMRKITARSAQVLVNGVPKGGAVTCGGTALTVELHQAAAQDTVEIILPGDTEIAPNQVMDLLYSFLDQAEISFFMKDRIYQMVEQERKDPVSLLSGLQAMDIDEKLQRAVLEIEIIG